MRLTGRPNRPAAPTAKLEDLLRSAPDVLASARKAEGLHQLAADREPAVSAQAENPAIRPARLSSGSEREAASDVAASSSDPADLGPSLDHVLADCDAVTNGEGVFGGPWEDKIDAVVRAALPLSIILDQDRAAFDRVASHPKFPQSQRAPNMDNALLAVLFTAKPRNAAERKLVSDWTAKLEWARLTDKDPSTITLKAAKAAVRSKRRAERAAQARRTRDHRDVLTASNTLGGTTGARSSDHAQRTPPEVIIKVEAASQQAQPAFDMPVGGLGLLAFEHVSGGEGEWKRFVAVGRAVPLVMSEADRNAVLAVFQAEPNPRGADLLRALADALDSKGQFNSTHQATCSEESGHEYNR